MLSPFPERSPFTGMDGTPLDWAQRWMQELRNAVNAALTTIPGPYANDAAAAAAKVAKGKPYYRASGQVYVRLV